MATYRIKIGDTEYTATVVDRPGGGATVTIEDQSFEVETLGAPALASPAAAPTPTPAVAVAAPPVAAAPTPAPAGSGVIAAPIPGKVLSLKVKVGDSVSANQGVLILEAMKMENNVHSPAAGTVKEISVGEGSEVSTGQGLMVIE